MAIKRLRRIRDGKIYGYSARMAEYAGMEVVMCDADNNVVERFGELGEVTITGRKYNEGRTTPLDVEPEQSTPPVEQKESFSSALDRAVQESRTGS